MDTRVSELFSGADLATREIPSFLELLSWGHI